MNFLLTLLVWVSLVFLTQNPLNHTVLSLIKYFKFSKSKVFFVKLSNMAVISREKETYKMIYVRREIRNQLSSKGFCYLEGFFYFGLQRKKIKNYFSFLSLPQKSFDFRVWLLCCKSVKLIDIFVKTEQKWSEKKLM